MNKLLVLLTLAAVAIGAGCKKGLDRTSFGVLSPVNFPKTEAEFETYALEVYKPFGSKWSYSDGGTNQFLWHGMEWSNTFLNDLPSDLIASFPEWGGYWTEMSAANFLPRINHGADGHFQKTRFITRITKIIADIEAASISDAKKKQLVTEARMARGWLMYYLYTLYGTVPVILDASKIGTEAEADLTRPDKASFVAAAAEDLRYAADNLVKTPAEYGRFNKGIALGVLMRLYLFDKNYQQAEAVGREIIAMGYNLINNYQDLFRVATEKNDETIWAVSVDPAGDGTGAKGNFNAWGFYTYPSDYPGMLSSGARKGGYSNPSSFTATWAFYDSFDPLDKRRALLITTYNAVNSAGNPTGVVKTRANLRGPVIAKYPDDDATAFQGNDIPVLRYADVLLMMAEAINGHAGPNSEAIGFMNTVRARAGLGNLPAASTASKEAFAAAILQERAWELYFEGFRRIDLMRFGKWNEYLQAAGKTPNPAGANGYFPIPQYVLSAGNGKIQQNDGY